MSHNISRRALLAGAALAGASSAMAQKIPTNPDVVIIGAGSAGLAAGQELARAGISYVIVEAANRVGGRAYTESDRLGAPVDHGCSWINGSSNPFRRIGDLNGFTLVDHTSAGTDLFDIDGNPASATEMAAYDRAYGAFERALGRAGKAGKDIPASEVIPAMPYSAAVQTWEGPLNMSVDWDQVSTADWWNTASAQPSQIVHEGLGAIVATLAGEQPIALGTSVNNIDWSGSGVSVGTSAGTIRAKACILTVSMGVLQAEKIKFTPALPAAKQEAIHDIQMGLLVKIPLLFDGTRLGLTENNWVTYRIPEDAVGEACYYLAWPTGHDYMMGFVGGRFGWSLYAEGQEAVVDYALEQLFRIVGSDARKHFIKGFASDWADNPLTLGAYGAVRPGKHGARDIVQETLGDRVFFAGEAVAGELYGLVNGAYFSGKSAAQSVAKTLG